MGVTSALKLGPVLDNTRTILAIELLAAGQGIDLLRPLASSAPLERLHADLRTVVSAWIEDREMSPDIATASAFLDQQLPEHLDGLE